MNVVSTNLMGGLGNMMFQIAASYSISLRDKKKLICDTENMIVPHKSYDFYENNIFRKIEFNKGLTNQNLYNEPYFHFCEIPNFEGDLKINGYFQSEKYFKKYREKIIDLFSIDENTKNYITDTYSNILKNKTCSLHIRRGDYKNLSDYHVLLDIEYYKEAMSYFDNNCLFLIFSDDIDWCIENFKNNQNVFFVSNPTDIIDLYLMSMCDNNIIANSTFSWWGAWLNTNTDKKVIAPSKWFGPKNSHLQIKDLYCEEWIII